MKIPIIGASVLAMLAVTTPVTAADVIGVLAVAEPPGPSAELAELTHQLRFVAAERSAGVVDASALRERMTGQPSSATLAELDRAHAGALTTYQNGDFEGAVRTLRAVVQDLERLPPSAEGFSQWTRGMLRLARAEQTLGRGGEARDVLERLVRANPAVKADPNQYPPSFVRQVEETSAHVAALPRRKLGVSATAKGARIFVEGREAGAAPTTLELPPGRYRVSGLHGNVYVPAVVVDLNEEGQSVKLDFALAESLRPGLGPGLALSEADRARNIVSAGSWLGVDKLVATKLVTDAGVEYLAGTCYDVRRGMLLREARVRLSNKVPPAGGLTALASFLITGQMSDAAQVQIGPSRAIEADRARTLPSAETSTLAAEDGELSAMARRRYVEARVGASRTHLRILHGVDGMAGALGLRAGLRWTPEWAFELGSGLAAFGPRDFDADRGGWSFIGKAELTTFHVSAGAAWLPKTYRYVSLAGDVGMSFLKYYYWERSPPGLAGSSAANGGVSLKQESWAPRIGAELRFDYPTRWVTLGARVGVNAVSNGHAGDTSWTDAGGVTRELTWLEPGWVVDVPVSASVRYAF